MNLSNRILPLPENVIAQIKGSVSIKCLTDVIISLLKNSIDAHASKVNIRVDFRNQSCSVEDNGAGIAEIEFYGAGGLAQSHHTSKSSSDATYGCLGEFLSDLAALSHLTITSRDQETCRCNTLVLHLGKLVARYIPSTARQTLCLEAYTTSVHVNNLFANHPVRAKYLTRRESTSVVGVSLTHLKHALVALLLAWHQPLEVTVQDASSGSIVHIRHPEEIMSKHSIRRHVSFDVDLVTSIMTQVGFVKSRASKSCTLVSSSSQLVKVKGAFFLDSAPKSDLQFISIGMHPITAGCRYGFLFEVINSLVANSQFGAIDDDRSIDGTKSRPPDHSNKIHKAVDRGLIFYLHVEIQNPESSKVDHGPLATEIEPSVIEAISALVTAWLTRNNYVCRQVRNNYVCRQVRNNIGQALLLVPALPFHSVSALATAQPILLPILDEVNPSPKSNQMTDQVSDNGITWRNPISGQKHNVDQNTGFVSTDSIADHKIEECGDLTLAKRRKIEVRDQYSNEASERFRNSWLDGTVGKWKSPIFESCGRLIGTYAAPNSRLGQSLDGNDSAYSHHISRIQLKRAQWVAQVDNKFLLLRLPVSMDSSKSESSMLILIDQHAADERYKYEQLLAELCTTSNDHTIVSSFGHNSRVMTIRLHTVIELELSLEEFQMAQLHSNFFAKWGILFDAELPLTECLKEHDKPLRIFIIALPPTIAKRCMTQPKLLLDLIKTEFWKIKAIQSTSSFQSELKEEKAHSWLRMIGDCPQGIINLLQSRACRSAIMFNDKLSANQCEEMLSRLNDCAFPTLCAHGRPSVVPLVESAEKALQDGQISDEAYAPSSGDVTGKRFARAYKVWQKALALQRSSGNTTS